MTPAIREYSLKSYVGKHPTSELEALNEIIRAVPVTMGPVSWRPGIYFSLMRRVAGHGSVDATQSRLGATGYAADDDDGL